MLAWTLLILTCPSPITVSRVDCIELNHVHNEQAVCTFSQIIVWRNGHVAWWCTARDAGHARQVGGVWRMDVRDKSHNGIPGRLFRVESPSWIETWTQFDPEVLDRENVSREQREGL